MCEAASFPGELPRASREEERKALLGELEHYLERNSIGHVRSLPARSLCKRRWLYYHGDENYGLGNVLCAGTS